MTLIRFAKQSSRKNKGKHTLPYFYGCLAGESYLISFVVGEVHCAPA